MDNKFCSKCGTKLEEGTVFCPNCGAKDDAASATTSSAAKGTVTNRNIGIAILLTIVTCGLYGIYWFVCLTDDVNKAANKQDTSGALAFVLTLVTCGIYGIYWAYKMGKNMHEIGNEDNSILYIVLQVCGLGIVNYALIQNDLNKLA